MEGNTRKTEYGYTRNKREEKQNRDTKEKEGDTRETE